MGISRMKLSHKLLAGFGLVLLLFGAVSFFNIRAATQIKEKSLAIETERYRNAVEGIDVIHSSDRILANLRYAAEAANIEPFEKAEEMRVLFEKEVNRLKDYIVEDSDALTKLLAFEKSFADTFDIGRDMVMFSVEQDLLSFVESRNRFQEAVSQFSLSAAQLKEGLSSALHADLQSITRLTEKSVAWSLLVSVIGILLGILLALGISRDIARPMGLVAALARDMGEGQFVRRLKLKRRDEIGVVADAMDETADKLENLVRHLESSTRELTEVSRDISNVSGRVDEGVQVQARGIDETSSAVTQISSSVKTVGEGIDTLSVSAGEATSSVLEMAANTEEVAQNAEILAQSVEDLGASMAEMGASVEQVAGSVRVLKESSDTTASSVAELDISIKEVENNAKETATITQEVRQDAEAGKVSVEATITGISQIREASEMAVGVIRSLAERATNIGSILSVIDDVTDQTSLLALNAAIIAAQAGEHGRGFSVVADEIRELAERTSSSTREINTMIQGVQDETRRAVDAITRAETSISEGESLSQKSGEMLGRIVEGSRRAAQRMDHVAKATVEQSQGTRMIRTSVERMTEMVDQIAAATREQGRGSEMILAGAEKMKELTSQVKNSTREQSSGGRVISRSMENISEMVARIKLACREQAEGSGQIVRATVDIQDSSGGNLESVRSLNEAVIRLTRQIAALQQEMDAFQGQEQKSVKSEDLLASSESSPVLA